MKGQLVRRVILYEARFRLKVLTPVKIADQRYSLASSSS